MNIGAAQGRARLAGRAVAFAFTLGAIPLGMAPRGEMALGAADAPGRASMMADSHIRGALDGGRPRMETRDQSGAVGTGSASGGAIELRAPVIRSHPGATPIIDFGTGAAGGGSAGRRG